MAWYHLSPDSALDSIVPSTTAKTLTSITPRVPNNSYAEDQTTCRVCVTPTVWQCVLSIPREGTFHIYRIDTEFVSNPIGSIADIETTHEKWITDDDVRRSDDVIALAYVGPIDITPQLKRSLKIRNEQDKLPFRPNDESRIWDIHGGQWSLKPQLIVG